MPMPRPIPNFRGKDSERGNTLNETLKNLGVVMNGGNLSNVEINKLKQIREAWNFYEGYHWEGLEDLDVPQVTFNYCRPFVNKFVSFEFGKGFTFKTSPQMEDKTVTVGDTKVEEDADLDKNGVTTVSEVVDESNTPNVVVREKTSEEFLIDVWKDNKRDTLLVEIGQTKSITGEAWVKVQFFAPEDLDDPFEEYPKGRIKLSCVPTQYVFPEFDDHDSEKLVRLTIMYPISRKQKSPILRRVTEKTLLYKEIWTADDIRVFEGSTEIDVFENPYGFIPFVQIKNFPVAGHSRGTGDLDDIIPLNVELNTKKSDVSEVIDYHSAPITLVYGAKIGNLEKGANKVWGGLPKDSRVENLGLQGDLTASSNYIAEIKSSMCEIGGIPETVLGGATAISNTSGVALQYMNMPLVERTNIKRECSKTGLETINKFILYIAQIEGLITKPAEVSMRDFLYTQVQIKDTLPKDEIIELSKIQQEMMMGIECRHGGMERLGKENINEKLLEIDKERMENPEIFNSTLQQAWYNNRLNMGGMMNGQNPQETIRVETTGQNGGATPV